MERKVGAQARKKRKEFCEVRFVSSEHDAIPSKPNASLQVNEAVSTQGAGLQVNEAVSTQGAGLQISEAVSNQGADLQVVESAGGVAMQEQIECKAQLTLGRVRQKCSKSMMIIYLCVLVCTIAAVATFCILLSRRNLPLAALYYCFQASAIVLAAAINIYVLVSRLNLPWLVVPLPLVIAVCTFMASFGGYVCVSALLFGAGYFAFASGSCDVVGRTIGTTIAAVLSALCVWQLSEIIPPIQGFGQLGGDISTLIAGAAVGGIISAVIFAVYNITSGTPFAAVWGLPALIAANFLFNICVGGVLILISTSATFVYSSTIVYVCLALACVSAVALILAIGFRTPIKYIYMCAVVPVFLIYGAVKMIISLLKKVKY